MRIAAFGGLGLFNSLLHVPDAPFVDAWARRGVTVAETVARH
ncbi:hypothetical protein [Mesorhizobium sp. CA13]|nr:hypothetical protein [Mesorhizobium sp. CA13]